MNIIKRSIWSVWRLLCAVAIDGLLLAIDSMTPHKGHTATFGSILKIARRYNKGFVVSRAGKLTRKASFENLLIVGGTGSGKTSTLLIPTLLNLKHCSILVHDPSKELFERCSKYLSQHFDIIVINFSDALKSMGYNILSRIKRLNDIQKLADLLARAALEGGNQDPFWLIKTKECLSILIRVTIYQSDEYKTMPNVLYLLNLLISEPETVDLIVIRSKDEKLLLDYKSFTAQSDKVLQSVLSSAKAALQLWDDDQVAAVSSTQSWDFQQLRSRPTVVFLHNSIANQAYYSTLNSILFSQFYEFALKELPGKNDLDIFVILEELSSLNLGKLLPLALSNCRKYRIGSICALQSISSLEPYYGKDSETIVNNCITKIYMAGLSSLDTLKTIEAFSGQYTYKEKDTEKTKQLVTLAEARQIKKNRTFILHSNLPIIKGRLQPYYKNRVYRQYCEMPPISICSDIPEEPIKLIPIEKKEVAS